MKTFTLKVNSKKILNAYKETLGSRLAQENRIYIKTEETRLQTKKKKSKKFWQWVLMKTSKEKTNFFNKNKQIQKYYI